MSLNPKNAPVYAILAPNLLPFCYSGPRAQQAEDPWLGGHYLHSLDALALQQVMKSAAPFRTD